MTERSRTKTLTPRLSEVAKEVAVPDGVTSSGWPSVEAKCGDFGVRFRPWQVGAGKLILAKRSSGKYAATIGGTGLSIPRQVGKTFLVGAIVFALCLLHPKLTVIWTAHRARTAEETFGKMQAFAKRKRIAPHVDRVVLGSGEEAIQFRNGSRILFGARAREFGRGFDEVDILIFDEAQILTEAVLDDMIPATNQSRQPSGALLLFMGTPPRPRDPGEVFTRMRDEALSGEDDDTAWVEFGGDEGYTPTPLPAPLTEADWDQVAKANPSFPQDTPREAILRMRKKLGPDSFLREGMGIWDKVNLDLSVVPADDWRKRLVEPAAAPAPDAEPSALAVDRWHDGSTSVAAAWRTDGTCHVELVAVDVTQDTAQVVRWVAERSKGRRIPVVVAGDSPAAALSADLRAAGVRLITANAQDVGKACVGFLDDVESARLTHADQEQLNTALAVAKKRSIGQAGAWGWDRKSAELDISPLMAVTLARFGAVVAQRKKTGPEAGSRVVVLS